MQPSVPGHLATDLFRPWLPGIVLVASVVLTEGMVSVIWAGILGFGVDCLSIERLGVHLVVATAVAVGIILVRNDERPHGVILFGSLVFSATFLWRSLAAVIHGILDRSAFDFSSVSGFALIEAISTAGLVVGAMLCCRLVIRVLKPKEQSSIVLANRWSMLSGK